MSAVITSGVNEVEQIDLSAFAVAGTTKYTLTFGTSTTPSILYTGTSADAGNIAAALNAASFATIGGVGGVVSVLQTAPAVFAITFGGTLALQNLPATLSAAATNPTFVPVETTLVAGALPIHKYTISFAGGSLANVPLKVTPTSPANSFTVAGNAGPTGAIVTNTLTQNAVGAQQVMFAGAIAQAPNDSSTYYLGLGEGNNTDDAYYGGRLVYFGVHVRPNLATCHR